MMGAQDLPAGQCNPKSAEGQLDGQIDRLNKEWREKRVNYHAAHSSRASTPIPGDGPLEVIGALAPVREPRGQRSEGVVDHGLAAAALSGSVQECVRLLDSGITRAVSWGPDGATPLFSAAFGGHPEVVRLLLDRAANPSQQNRSRQRPTALHAAALKGYGKICMVLLEKRADPRIQDANGVTPVDYGSCSEAVWPLFAASGCARVTKDELVAKGVIRKASSSLEHELSALGVADDNSGSHGGLLREFSRPGSAYVATASHPPRPGSAASGGALLVASYAGGPPGAGSAAGTGTRPGSRSGKLQISGPIDILAEGDDAGDGMTARSAGGYQSLGL